MARAPAKPKQKTKKQPRSKKAAASAPRFETRLIHAGQDPDPATGAVVYPIHTTTTYAQSDVGVHKGWDYSRAGNPTRDRLEANLASLEGGVAGFAFASGMAGIATMTHLLNAGDHVIAEENVYGGTVRYFSQVAARFGVEFTFVDMSDPANVERAMRENTQLVYAETPTNPNLKLADLAALADLAHDYDCLLAVDNTFASPYLQRPIARGADIVVHSATKYLGGHSDVIAGAVVVADADIAERLRFLVKSVGAVLSPFDAFLLQRGIKTLAVRMDRHSRNAQEIAEFLIAHPKVSRVMYPGLKDHPQHDLAKRQMSDFGGMLSFELKGGVKASRKVMKATKVWTLAESLGAVESLISHPWSMTHASIPEPQRVKAGVTEGLVRLSVGLENVDDLVEDLEQALARV